ncbi:MAG: hypothetical protein J5767_12505 [Paludibacteraceae bacterium]|nr:hypothetical protein [Paludibacteraceae bacterium]
MKNEDLDFLINLQKELLEQNEKYHLCQADPIYVGIMDYWFEVKPEDYAEEMHVMCFGESEYNMDEFIQYLFEDYDLKDTNTPKDEIIDSFKDCSTTDDLREVIDEYFSDIDSSDYDIVYVSKAGHLAPNCCFITWADAVEHLKYNKHHYSADAHPYTMTAFRSPQLEKLLEIVKTTEWEMIKTKQKGVEV